MYLIYSILFNIFMCIKYVRQTNGRGGVHDLILKNIPDQLRKRESRRIFIFFKLCGDGVIVRNTDYM